MSATTATPAVKAPKTASDFAVTPPRPSPYRVADGAKRASVGKGHVARGVRVARKDGEKDVPTLLYVSGDTITPAATLAHIGAAIRCGVISREEIDYLHGLENA